MISDSFKVEGGHSLNGILQPQGAKNEVLQILCAVLLTSEKITVYNVPDIIDVRLLIKLLSGLGVQVERLGPESYSFEARDIDLEHFKSPEFYENSRKIRGSVMLIGPLLARFNKAYIPKPGGDKIGRRRIDTHILGFQKLGATFHYNDKDATYTIDASKLQG
ncbi:UNVERIFIED_CONTAM: hypothetical protein GTU68_007527, partial [Idotea baltica]|nr:hypothetical protein [Idotea baltica]